MQVEEMEGVINIGIFEQLLEMDEDGDHEFSKSITDDYFEQADDAFEKMEACLSSAPPDLTEAGKLGHFLKGSSAAIGVDKVKNICEKIQHWGALKDPVHATPIDAADAEGLIRENLRQARIDFKEAKIVLQKFFGGGDGAAEDDEEKAAEEATASSYTSASPQASAASPLHSPTRLEESAHPPSSASPTRSIHSESLRHSPSRDSDAASSSAH